MNVPLDKQVQFPADNNLCYVVLGHKNTDSTQIVTMEETIYRIR